ncbi:hypothetical protein V8B97DRAFT_1877899 [Scleroderma yunnanense]
MKFLPYPRLNLPEALALHFTGDSLKVGADANIGLNDAEVVPFLTSVKHLSHNALQEAVLMKHAGHETRHYWALASAWELKEAEHYGKLMAHIHPKDCKTYNGFKNSVVDKRAGIMLEVEESEVQSMDSMESLMALYHKAYNKDLASFHTANTQLDHSKKKQNPAFH